MTISLWVLSTSQEGSRGPEELVAQQLASLLNASVKVRPWTVEAMADDAVFLCFWRYGFAPDPDSPLSAHQQYIHYQDSMNAMMQEVWRSPNLRRCVTFLDCVKVATVVEGTAGDCHYSPESLEARSVTTQGFFGRRWEVSLMDGIAKKYFSSESFSFFETPLPLPTIEILVEYCHVLYGVEWINTLDVAAPGRTVQEQHYLTLVGIYEGARRFLQDVSAALVVSAETVETVVEVFPALAPPDDPRRPIAQALVREAAAALEAMWKEPPVTMAPHLVARMHKRYSLEELQRAQRQE